MESSNFVSCKIHDDLPILFYCTDENCYKNSSCNDFNPNIHNVQKLCEICLNLHDKSHKFIISSNSLLDETYEKIVNNNIEKATKIKENIEKLNRIFTEQINKEFKSFTDKFMLLIEKSKADIINKIELQKTKSFEEIEIWKELKIKLEKTSIHAFKQQKSSNLNLHTNNELNNSIEIDDSKFIQELKFLSSDKKNHSNNDINLSCMSKDDNTKDNFNLNLYNNNPSLFNNVNFFNNNTFIPEGNVNLLGQTNNITNVNLAQNNKNFFLENKLKLISIILEKHLEHFINFQNFGNNDSQRNNNNFSENAETKNKENNSSTNNLRFSHHAKILLKNFCMEFNFKLKNLIESNLPLNSYLNSKNINNIIQNINGDTKNNMEENNIIVLNNNNNIYKNSINNDPIKQNVFKKRGSYYNIDKPQGNLNFLNNFNSDANENNCVENNQYEILDKNIAAYGNKKNNNNEKDIFMFDANGGEYSPKNSMILNFNANNDKFKFNLDTLTSTREIASNNKYISHRNDGFKSYNKISGDIEDNFLNLPNFQHEKIDENIKQLKNLTKEEKAYFAKFERKGINHEGKPTHSPNINAIKLANKVKNNNLVNDNFTNNKVEENEVLSHREIRSSSMLKGKIKNKVNSYNDNLYNIKDEFFEIFKDKNDNLNKEIQENINIHSILPNKTEKNQNLLAISSEDLINNKKSTKSISMSKSEKNINFKNSGKTEKKIISNNFSYSESEEFAENNKRDFQNNTDSQHSNKKSNLMKINNNNIISSVNFFTQTKNNKIDFQLIEDFNHKKFELEDAENILNSKKGSWYSLDYIESHNFLVCGFENGEIVIFKESDYSLIRTYRPRFKRIRKLMYSAENSSIFVCYDDGFFIIINIIDFKFESYRKSENQIYTFDIMKNYNILVWGGYDKKIMFSPINNMETTQLFWESKHGEIQAIFYDLESEVLVASFRKNKVAFFNFKNSEIYKQFSIEENDDACGMVIKKYDYSSFNLSSRQNYKSDSENKKSTILISGFYMCIHQFEISVYQKNSVKVEFIRYIKTPYTHIYDIFFITEKYFLISTFEEGKIVLLDFEENKIIKVFKSFYNAVLQIKLVKNKFYLTSHMDYLKKVEYNM